MTLQWGQRKRETERVTRKEEKRETETVTQGKRERETERVTQGERDRNSDTGRERETGRESDTGRERKRETVTVTQGEREHRLRGKLDRTNFLRLAFIIMLAIAITVVNSNIPNNSPEHAGSPVFSHPGQRLWGQCSGAFICFSPLRNNKQQLPGSQSHCWSPLY